MMEQYLQQTQDHPPLSGYSSQRTEPAQNQPLLKLSHLQRQKSIEENQAALLSSIFAEAEAKNVVSGTGSDIKTWQKNIGISEDEQESMQEIDIENSNPNASQNLSNYSYSETGADDAGAFAFQTSLGQKSMFSSFNPKLSSIEEAKMLLNFKPSSIENPKEQQRRLIQEIISPSNPGESMTSQFETSGDEVQ